ncbi:MAG: Sodium/hydrogen exchanger 1 [Marteilia pararefringens]
MIVLLLFSIFLDTFTQCSSQPQDDSNKKHDYYDLLLLHFQFNKTQIYNQIAHIILIILMLKLLYTICNKYSRHFPESGLFVLIGILLSMAEIYIGSATSLYSSESFFYLILPVIIIDAGFYLPVKSIVNNLCPVLYFAFVGTLLNAILLALIIYAFKIVGCKYYKEWCQAAFTELQAIHAIFYAVVISAVDPVAVLALFEHANINPKLYSLVFGESLFNDGVAIVLYLTLKPTILNGNIENYGKLFAAGFIKFLLSCVVGILLGMLVGLFGIIFSKYSYHMVIIEPVAMFMIMYIAYIISESLHYSAIFSAVAAAVMMKPYILKNLSKASVTALNFTIQIFRHIAEDGVFILIGIVNVYELKVGSIDYVFIVILILATLLVRFLVTFGSGFFINRFIASDGNEISLKDLFILAYGGLRGAISLSLSLNMMNEVFNRPGATPQLRTLGETLNNATMIFVIFTIWVQGTTMNLFLKCFKVKKAPESRYPFFERLNSSVFEELMDGFHEITKSKDSTIVHKFESFNNKYLRRLFLREHNLSRQQEKIIDIFNNAPDQSMNANLQGVQNQADLYKDAYMKIRNERKGKNELLKKEIDDGLINELNVDQRFKRLDTLRRSRSIA